MKKGFLYLLLSMLALPVFTACNDDDDELTDKRVTYYVDLVLNGDETTVVPLGSTYTDAGCNATVNGEDWSSHLVTEGVDDVNTSQVGLYPITYSAANSDGFSVSKSRTVVVSDPSVTTDMAGTYTVQAGTKRVTSSATTAYNGYTVTIKKVADGVFEISDMLGGYYDQRAGYGSSYVMHGYLRLKADNTIELLEGKVPAWGYTPRSFTDGSYDPSTKTVKFKCNMEGYIFDVILSI